MLEIFIQIYFLIYVVVAKQEAVPEVKIDQGTLRGKYQQTWKGRTLSAFTGIPYAEPPVGDLRFKAPVPVGPWNGILDATRSPPVCPQMNIFINNFTITGNEDCLFLNVYTPQLPKTNKLYPVMFYLHAGAWTFGSGSSYGPEILLDKDVVFVTTNYRLGPLGFLSTGDEVVPGNNGLKDQNSALKWVKKNIAQFGGDPEKITVFGQSAGGASAHYHMLSPLSRDLISGVIAQSGTAFGSWGVAGKERGVENTKRLAHFLNCSTQSSQEIVDCLRKVKAEDIVQQDPKFAEWSYDPIIPFPPIIEPNIEGAFLPEDPIEIIKSGKAANVPFITGITTEDGAIKSAFLYNNTNLVKELNEEFDKLAPILFLYQNITYKDFVTHKIRKFYFDDMQIDNSKKTDVTDMFTDGWFLLAADTAVRLHGRYSKQPVYYYLFGYRGSTTHGSLFGDSSHNYGVCHGDDLLYLLSDDMLKDYEPNASDKKMRDVMTTLWANFAETGNPTPKTDSLLPVEWTPVRSHNLEYYHVESGGDIKMKLDIGFYPDRASFWRHLPLSSRLNANNTQV